MFSSQGNKRRRDDKGMSKSQKKTLSAPGNAQQNLDDDSLQYAVAFPGTAFGQYSFSNQNATEALPSQSDRLQQSTPSSRSALNQSSYSTRNATGASPSQGNGAQQAWPSGPSASSQETYSAQNAPSQSGTASREPFKPTQPCPICDDPLYSEPLRYHLRSHHLSPSTFLHVCGYCCASFDNGLQWVEHVIECGPSNLWMMENQVLGALRHHIASPEIRMRFESIVMNLVIGPHIVHGSGPNYPNLKYLLIAMETISTLFDWQYLEAVRLLGCQGICVHRIVDLSWTADRVNILTSCSTCSQHEQPRGSAPETARRCVECDITFESETQFNAHNNDVHPIYFRCEQCNSKFLLREQWRSHMWAQHEGQRHPCSADKCDERFVKVVELEVHWANKHPEIAPTDLKLPQCEHCKRYFVADSVLKNHMISHEATPDIFWCPAPGCTSRSRYKSNVREHMRQRHPGLQVEHFVQKPGGLGPRGETYTQRGH